HVPTTPDGVVRTRLPEVGPSNDTGPSAHSAPVQPPAPKLRARLLAVPLIAREQIRTALETEAGRGAFFLLRPVFAVFGAIIYFTLSFEPAWT
ncbi:competence protein ComEC, partial [Brucella oryzae]